MIASDRAESVCPRVGNADFWSVCVNGTLCPKILTGKAHWFVYIKTLYWHNFPLYCSYIRHFISNLSCKKNGTRDLVVFYLSRLSENSKAVISGNLAEGPWGDGSGCWEYRHPCLCCVCRKNCLQTHIYQPNGSLRDSCVPMNTG